MSAVVVGAAVIGAGAGIYNQNKASKAAKDAAKAGQVDINAVDEATRRIALRNAQESADLEQAMTPEVPELRRTANQAVLSGVGTSATDDYMRGQLSHMSENQVAAGRTPLLQAAIAKAKADLALGGRLDASTQNAVSRAALGKSGQVGSLGLGRDMVARDLGLTSLDLEQRRLAAASQLGGQELAGAQYQTDTDFNNRAGILNAMGMLNQVQGSQFGRNLAAAQYGESIQRPVVGLDPASAGNLMVGNANNAQAAASNRADMYGAQSQNWMNLAGQFGGAAMMNYNKTGSGAGAGGGAPNKIPNYYGNERP
jgi:hypothetical protein